jgi:hypothetical protein
MIKPGVDMGVAEKGQRLTPEVMKFIEDRMAEGCYEKLIYELLNIPLETWYWWKKEAKKLEKKLESGKLSVDDLKDGDKRILELLQILKKGRATCISKNIRNIQNAGADPDHWQASAWYLERIEPTVFGRPNTLKHEGELTIKVKYE